MSDLEALRAEGLGQHVETARITEAVQQVVDLNEALDLDRERYLHIPFAPVDRLVGGLMPGSLWFVLAFSGDGKSTFFMSALERLLDMGKRVAYLGLETMPWKLRVHLACRQLDLDPGDVITGKILEHPDGYHLRQEVKRVAESFVTIDWIRRLRFFPYSYIGVDQLEEASPAAVDMEADVVIIDHVDHIEGGDGRDPFAESVKAIKKLHDLRQSLGLTYLVASQLNNEAVKRDVLARYRPAEPHMVYMGGHKRQVADGMLSIYRPLQLPPNDKEGIKLWRERLADARTGGRKVRDLLIPNTMGVAVMKHREYNREGLRCYLHVDKGKVRELEHNEAAARGLLEETY